MPKSPVSREQANRFISEAAAWTGRVLVRLGRFIARVAAQIGRALSAVPPALRPMCTLGVLVLCGVVGSITLTGPLELACAIVVVPVCSIALGALGHRWYLEHDGAEAQPGAAVPGVARSVGYVDQKLAVALNSLGNDRHQQAVIALVQAKTAVELTLGTEHDDRDPAWNIDEHHLRPRIRAGSTTKLPLHEGNSLAAS
jgi:hypothetical protein